MVYFTSRRIEENNPKNYISYDSLLRDLIRKYPKLGEAIKDKCNSIALIAYHSNINITLFNQQPYILRTDISEIEKEVLRTVK